MTFYPCRDVPTFLVTFKIKNGDDANLPSVMSKDEKLDPKRVDVSVNVSVTREF